MVERIVKRRKELLGTLLVLVLLWQLLATHTQQAFAFQSLGQWPYGSTPINTLVYKDGIVYAGGDGGYFAMYNTQTQAWSGVGQWPAGTDAIRKIVVLNGGTIFMIGNSGSYAIYNDGWVTWGSRPELGSYAALLVDGDTVWAGGSNGYTACWTPNNGWQSTGRWPYLTDSITALCLYKGEMYAFGNRGRFARWNGTGWDGLGQWCYGSTSISRVCSNGKILLATGVGGYSACWDGDLWNALGQWPGGTTTVMDCALAPDGSIWAVGYSQGYVARYTTMWESMGQPCGVESLYAIVVSDEGQIFIGSSKGRLYTGYAILSPPILQATIVNSYDVHLSWSQVADANRYIIEKSTNLQTWSVLASVTGTDYTDAGLAPGTYYYRVKAANDASTSAPSNVVTVTIQSALPETISLQASLNNRDTVLTWSGGANADYFLLERSTDGENYNPIAQLTTKSYIDKELPDGTYYYRVKGINEEGEVTSNIATVTVQLIPPCIDVHRDDDSIIIDIDLDEPFTGTAYLYRRDSNTQKWFCVTQFYGDNATEFHYTDAWVAQGVTYQYALRVLGGLAEAYEWQTLAQSDWVGGAAQPAPAGLHIVSLSDSGALIGWDAMPGATTYTVETSTDGGETWTSQTVSGTSKTVPRACLVRLKAGTLARSQWSGVLTVP